MRQMAGARVPIAQPKHSAQGPLSLAVKSFGGVICPLRTATNGWNARAHRAAETQCSRTAIARCKIIWRAKSKNEQK
jgi:hypothetical protein